MNRCARSRRQFAVALLWTLAAGLMAPAAVSAQSGAEEQARPAELMPLANRSLLLDLARAGTRVVSVGERGHILLSDDAGRSWRQVPVPSRSTLTAVHFVDDQVGWAVGHDATIVVTRDSGRSWQLQHFDAQSDAPLLDVWFADRDRGIAVGAYGRLMRTVDSGLNWEDGLLSEDEDFHLNQVSDDPEGRLWIAAEAGSLYRSPDSGETWQVQDSPYEGSLFGVQAAGTEVLLLYGLRGHLYRSVDGGENWREIVTGTPALLHGSTRLSDGTAVIVGMDGTLLVSDPEARRFRLIPQPDRLGLTAVLEADGGLVFSGEGGVRRLELDSLKAMQ